MNLRRPRQLVRSQPSSRPQCPCRHSGCEHGGHEHGPEAGTVSIVGVGLVLMILLVGGISLDLWRVVVQHRALAEVADAAAAAGSNGIDLEHFRSSGEVVLDVDQASAYAYWSLANQDLPTSFTEVSGVRVEPGRITVVVRGRVDFSLLSLVSPGGGLDVEVEATASPRSGGG